MSDKLTPAGIEYGDLNWNFYPGCKHRPQGLCQVPACWAEAMWVRRMAAEKNKGVILPDFHHPHLEVDRLYSPMGRIKPAVVLVNFMGDLFGDWVDPDQWVEVRPENGEFEDFGGQLRSIVFGVIEACPQHTFVFLTKAWRNLEKWGKFPNNAWVGASVTYGRHLYDAMQCLSEVECGGRWLSIEPMLGPIVPMIWPHPQWDMIGWVVIGAQSQPTLYPKQDWVEDLVMECLAAKKPVWLKNNVAPGLAKSLPFYVPPQVPTEGPFAERGPFQMRYRQERPF